MGVVISFPGHYPTVPDYVTREYSTLLPVCGNYHIIDITIVKIVS